MRLIQLRIKIRSIAEEQRIIRHEEGRLKKTKRYRENVEEARSTLHSLQHHRRHDLRMDARLSLLAYAAMRGLPYAMVEIKSDLKPDFAKVFEMAKRFGAEEGEAKAWVAEAHAYYNKQLLDRPVVQEVELVREPVLADG